MRKRVAAVVFVLAVLLVAAIVASHFLERVEAPVSTPLVDAPLPAPRVEAPKTLTRVAPSIPDAALAVVNDVGTSPHRDFPSADPVNVPFYAGPGSTALGEVCQRAVESCALKHTPWFGSTLSAELELERGVVGSRIARAHAGLNQRNGPPAFTKCVVDMLQGSELPELPLDADQQMVRCVPRVSKTKTAFPSGAKLRDELKRCLPRMPEGEVAVKFSVVNDNGILKNGELTFSGLGEVDAYARRCLELGLETKVPASSGEIPAVLPTVSLSVSDDGRKVSNSYSFGPP